jgi:iron complex transport system substrate-binding protein
MKLFLSTYLFFFILLLFSACKKNTPLEEIPQKNISQISYAKGFTIQNYDAFSVLTIKNPWPNATKNYSYLLKEKNAIVPDSLSKMTTITVPIKKVIVTSTTHISPLEMLHEENSLVGFPNLSYISSNKIRQRIDAEKIIEVGKNENLIIEKVIDIQPDVVIGFGINNNNPSFDNIEKSGLKIIFNGDWNESTVLGKAEWLKFFGALYCKQETANKLFEKIKTDYIATIELAKKAKSKPTVLSGDMYEGKWYLPKGDSWGCQLLKQAQSNYLWANSTGTGSLSLSFEKVFETANEADFWFTSGQFSSLKELQQANIHYSKFKSFKNKNVYSFTKSKGKSNGIIYFELGPSRPDIIMKDLVKILHPELLKDYKPFFFNKLE